MPLNTITDPSTAGYVLSYLTILTFDPLATIVPESAIPPIAVSLPDINEYMVGLLRKGNGTNKDAVPVPLVVTVTVMFINTVRPNFLERTMDDAVVSVPPEAIGTGVVCVHAPAIPPVPARLRSGALTVPANKPLPLASTDARTVPPVGADRTAKVVGV